MTIPYTLKSGDVIPFVQGDAVEERNRQTHIWTKIRYPGPAEFAGLTLPTHTLRCVLCGSLWFDEEAKYPCGKPDRFGEDGVFYYTRNPYRPAYRSWDEQDVS